MPSTSALQVGLVRPRYQDGELEEPLPLEGLYRERFLTRGAPPAALVVIGPRGAGVSTALRHLAALEPEAGEERLEALDGQALLSRPEALDALAEGRAVLFLDTSLRGSATDRRWEAQVRAASADSPLACCRLVLGRTPVVPGEARSLAAALSAGRRLCQLTWLAPWTRDDLVDLLASPALRAPRQLVLAGLLALPALAPALARPRAARRLIDAALAQDGPLTLARLYAQVLDELAPDTLTVLRALSPDVHLGDPALLAAWHDAGYPAAPEVREQVVDLFQLSPRMAAILDPQEQTPPVSDEPQAALLLPGLAEFLQAGDAVQRLAQGTPPQRLKAGWLPHLTELVSPSLRAELRRALLEGPRGPDWDTCAATALHACGEAVPFQARGAPFDLGGAHLAGAALPGAALVSADLRGADLSRAELPGADLGRARLEETRLAGATLDGASLLLADLVDVRLDGASLRGARLDEAALVRCDLSDAALEGARLPGARLSLCRLFQARLVGADLLRAQLTDCDLRGADLSEARLCEATISALDLNGADLSRADLSRAELGQTDLRGLVGVPTSLRSARCRRVGLTGLVLDGLRALEVELHEADLSDVALRGAELTRARFVACRAHGAVFDGADLRGAIFEGVSFQAGSSRAGLLLGAPPLEGSRTGFYAEGTTDEAWSSPDALCQASFRGADLRGARFVRTPLFRVDLRGARLDPSFEAQAHEAGAIL